MKAVIVTYRVAEPFSETNAANINRFIADMWALDDEGIRYHAFRQRDGVTFVHVAMFSDHAAAKRASAVESFQAFQDALTASNPPVPPTSQWLELIGTTMPF